MALTDPIADYLTRIRNAQMAGHRMVTIPASNLKKSITEILYNQGYILKYKFEETENKQGQILIALKYDRETKRPVIQKLKRVSRPGLRHYVKASELPNIINGLGTAVVSTSKGVLTEKTARKENVGGEVLFYVY
ncbi:MULTISPECIES: 30S ribosomal protein S8 [unclassified Aureispira]|uniref:30S ribosomal protein S8 n=1 Tax=unclassified Aureispira TaxID=2649989 RepID=UPI00069716B2|nr:MULTISPECIES: 30S ribosomal protein S8 [unclassified Aureispira]WMX14812.1 30S ribosomal protein S8 [Aureispira sp. CCB-E]